MSTKTPNPDDEVICLCSGTKRCDIERWFWQGLDMESISRKTGALSGCAGCEWDISELLKNLAEKQAAAN